MVNKGLLSFIFVTAIVITTSSSYAQTVTTSSIARMADAICGTPVKSGSSTTTTVRTAKVTPEVFKELKRNSSDMKGVSFDQDRITISRTEGDDIKVKDVAQHNRDVLKCRKQVALSVLSNR